MAAKAARTAPLTAFESLKCRSLPSTSLYRRPSTRCFASQTFDRDIESGFLDNSKNNTSGEGSSTPFGKPRNTNISRLISMSQNSKFDSATPSDSSSILSTLNNAKRFIANPLPQAKLPHRLHVYAHRHNMHLTLAKPNGEPLLSLSCGNIGFRKGQRDGYEAAHQLTSFMIGKIQEKGFLMNMDGLEVVYRGFGAGREAFTKILLGKEGTALRNQVVRVTDATRLKFGGTRSPNIRRLG